MVILSKKRADSAQRVAEQVWGVSGLPASISIHGLVSEDRDLQPESAADVICDSGVVLTLDEYRLFPRAGSMPLMH
jgi:hypothetical protein